MVIYEKRLTLCYIEAKWLSKQNIVIAATILAESGP